MANPEVQRGLRIQVRLSEDMVERINGLAHQMGIPAATLASVAVAEYVNRHDTQRQQLVLIAEKVAESAEKAAETFFADPQAMAMLAGAMAEAEAKPAGKAAAKAVGKRKSR